MTRILILGKDGQVGFELARRLSGSGDVLAIGREQMDLANPGSIRAGIREFRPGLIINAAAYTAVDRAEVEPELAMAVNGIAPGVMAEEAGRLDAVLVHYSTDYVFDGANTSPYSEEDETQPINVYGRTKLEGERRIQSAGIPHLVLRTSWVYGRRGKNFMLTMLRLARERDDIQVVNDQWGVPTSGEWLARITGTILQRMGLGTPAFPGTAERQSGTYHVVAGGRTSWFGFAEAILANAVRTEEVLREFRIRRPAVLKSISTAEYHVRTPRPACTVLANGKAQQAFSLDISTWQEALEACMTRPETNERHD